MNRVWQQHFGAGLVRTANDFGLNGERPSHPALLDWLEATLVEGGWQLKPLHQLIMASAVYQQGGELKPANLKADPENKLLGVYPRKRLEAEVIRDSLLYASGLLVDSLDISAPLAGRPTPPRGRA